MIVNLFYWCLSYWKRATPRKADRSYQQWLEEQDYPFYGGPFDGSSARYHGFVIRSLFHQEGVYVFTGEKYTWMVKLEIDKT